jgi:hypothetical protein
MTHPVVNVAIEAAHATCETEIVREIKRFHPDNTGHYTR